MKKTTIKARTPDNNNLCLKKSQKLLYPLAQQNSLLREHVSKSPIPIKCNNF